METRQEGGAGFTDAVTRALIAEATGGTVRTASATAALEAAAGAYSRAFALAEVSPSTPTTRALTPALLALAGRDLVRRGEFLWVVDVDRTGAVTLLPAGSWDIEGGPAEAGWWYRCDLFGPSGNQTIRRPAAAVIHGRYSVDPARPWFGVSPLGWASLTGRLHGALEDALADESGGTRGHVLPVPQGPDPDADDDDTADPNAQLRADVRTLRGRTALVETTAAGWGEGQGAAPRADWKPQRIGAAPPAPLVDLRDGSARAVLAACGVPPTLFGTGGDAAGAREAWRMFLHGSLQPVADLLAAELAVKLEAPDLALSFSGLFASDLQGRARAYRAMVGPQGPAVPEADARRLAGLN